MAAKKLEVRKLSDLKTNKFVRVELDTAHVNMLAGLIHEKVELPPIIINTRNEVIDGRHRKEAYEVEGKQVVTCEVRDIVDNAEMIALAYRCNVGGSKPPTMRDTEHTVVSLLNNDVPKRAIAEMLGLPTGLARNYINMVESRQNAAKLRRAADSILDDNVPLVTAAEKHGVPKEKLKEHLESVRKKKYNLGAVKNELSAAHKSYSMTQVSALKAALNLWLNGEIGEGHVNELLVHVESLNKRGGLNIKNLRERVEAQLKDGEPKLASKR